MLLTGVHGVVLSIGTYSTFNGSIAGGEVPPLLSLFGLVHFESIVFTIGTTVFVLTLVKERSEGPWSGVASCQCRARQPRPDEGDERDRALPRRRARRPCDAL
jgi:hypothetical protein